MRGIAWRSGAPRAGRPPGNGELGFRRGCDQLRARDRRVALDGAHDVGGRRPDEVPTLVEPGRCPGAAGQRQARTPGRPSVPPSRIAAAISRAAASVAAISTSKVRSGGRAATSTAPAVGCSRLGPVSGVSPPLSTRRCSRSRPPRGTSAASARLRARRREHGQLEPCPSRSARRSASAIAAPRCSSPRKTIGATSTAPMRGWAPRWRPRSIRATARARGEIRRRSCGGLVQRGYGRGGRGRATCGRAPDRTWRRSRRGPRRRGPRRRWGRRAARVGADQTPTLRSDADGHARAHPLTDPLGERRRALGTP